MGQADSGTTQVLNKHLSTSIQSEYSPSSSVSVWVLLAMNSESTTWPKDEPRPEFNSLAPFVFKEVGFIFENEVRILHVEDTSKTIWIDKEQDFSEISRSAQKD